MSTHPDGARFLSKSGLLAEINRTILHPLGLALCVDFSEGQGDGAWRFAGLLDVREKDQEGIVFDTDVLRIGMSRLATFMEQEGNARHAARRAKLGFVVQGGVAHEPQQWVRQRQALVDLAIAKGASRRECEEALLGTDPPDVSHLIAESAPR